MCVGRVVGGLKPRVQVAKPHHKRYEFGTVLQILVCRKSKPSKAGGTAGGAAPGHTVDTAAGTRNVGVGPGIQRGRHPWGAFDILVRPVHACANSVL